MQSLKESKLYKQIQKEQPSEVIIAYFIDTGFIIDEFNVNFLIETETIKRLQELQQVLTIYPEFKYDKNMINNIEKDFKNKIGENLLEVKYIKCSLNELDVNIEKVEKLDNFHHWGI